MQKLRLFSPDIAVDLGTANTIVYAKGEGVILNEPSMLAVADHGDKFRVVACGHAAKKMFGRTPTGIRVVRPVRAGAIAQYEMARAMLHEFLSTALGKRWSFLKPRMIIGVPPGVTDVEKRAIREAGLSVGAREVHLIDEAMAAALGCGLPIAEPQGSLVVDIGGGTTDIAAISLKGVVYGNSLRLGGDVMDDAIIQHMRKEHQLLIGYQTAELMKMTLASAALTGDEQEMEVQGQSVADGCPHTQTVSGKEIRVALETIILEIIRSIRAVLELLPPEIAADVMEGGINLTGGGSLIKGLDRKLGDEFAVPVVVADDPLGSVAVGAGKCLNNPELRELLF